MPLHSSLFFVVLAVGTHGAPSWPVEYSYSSDTMPIIQVRLAPPRKQLPQVAAAMGKLEAARETFETGGMLEVEVAYNASLERASKDLPALIDRLMGTFEKPLTLMTIRQRPTELTAAAELPHSTSFHEGRRSSRLGGQELTTRINLLPAAAPDAILETNLDEIEVKRTTEQGKVFGQAVSEMAGLTKIVQNEVEGQITQHVNAFLHALKFGLGANPVALLARAPATSFLSMEQVAPASGSQLTTNVRVMASEEPFQKVSDMAEDLERRRDASEDLLRKRLLEMEMKLVQAENHIISARLSAWIEHVLRR